MKFWKTGIVLAWGVLLPALGSAQEPWVTPSPGYAAPPGVGAEYGNFPPPPNSQLYEELVPQNRPYYYDDEERRHLTWKEAFSQSYIRLDYLNWNVSGSDNALLGAPVSGGADISGRDPDNMLLASDANGPRAPAPTSAVVPRLDNDYENLSGLRGVFGVPTNAGTFEFEAFYMEPLQNGVKILPYTSSNRLGLTTPVIAATTLFNNGALSPDTMILYSENFFAEQKTTFFGTEANWVFNPFTPGVPVTVSPVLGFKYVNLSDKFKMGGTDIADADDPTTELDHRISSIARNNVFGPQIGLRFATNHRYVNFAFEPKFVAGFNRINEGVYTSQIYSQTEADRSVKDQKTRFSPMLDLQVSSKVNFTDQFAVFIAYDLMFAGNFSRATSNIYYDAPILTTNPSQITLKSDLKNFVAQGLAIGGEFTFR
ncbi:BBP7 family outer membrane beta-barrel protein [Planctomicrobium sp. SH668]|uniref:BBP7 family outer membrane beta-barrel protein n=1 Tax=Planctomicrobium sp. SH668 TaxID=3448126 RepID=UPI003F5BB692